MINTPSLNTLKFFYYVALYGSVTRAAEHLCVTQGAVSKQIIHLEEMLEIALFHRVNKKLELTSEGQILYRSCEKVFDELENCFQELKRVDIKQKPLVVSCEPTLAMKWLIPRLNQFRELEYGFDVVLLTAGGAVDFKNDQIDLAIRRDDFLWSHALHRIKLVDEQLVWVERTDLAHHNVLLLSKSRPHFLHNLKKTKVLRKQLEKYSIQEFEHFYLCLEACLAGMGSTLISKFMVEKELENGILKQTEPPFLDGSAYFLLSSEPFDEDERKELFLKWLSEAFKAIN